MSSCFNFFSSPDMFCQRVRIPESEPAQERLNALDMEFVIVPIVSDVIVPQDGLVATAQKWLVRWEEVGFHIQKLITKHTSTTQNAATWVTVIALQENAFVEVDTTESRVSIWRVEAV